MLGSSISLCLYHKLYNKNIITCAPLVSNGREVHSILLLSWKYKAGKGGKVDYINEMQNQPTNPSSLINNIVE